MMPGTKTKLRSNAGWVSAFVAGLIAVATAGSCIGKPDKAEEASAQTPKLPLVDRPEAAFNREGLRQIREKLTERGRLKPGEAPVDDSRRKTVATLDGPMADALREVQSEAGLAKTGLPDAETLAALGLDPKALLRAEPIPEAAEKKKVPTLEEK